MFDVNKAIYACDDVICRDVYKRQAQPTMRAYWGSPAR